VSRHFFPTSSVDRTSVHVPTIDLANPDRNRRAAYAHTFGARAVRRPATDMDTRDTRSIFLRPRTESASVVSTKPPTRQPAKNDDAGSETSAGPAHWSAHSDTTDVLAGRSHAHVSSGNAHGEAAAGVQDELPATPTQCHCGSASVNTEMNTCCASKAQAKATKTALSSCMAPVSPMYFSIMSSIEAEGTFAGLALWLVRSGAVAVSAIDTVVCARAA
jgi:hypothetical protein